MKIFISWSKEESRLLAERIKDFIDDFFNNNIETWVSSKDIRLGASSYAEINKQIKTSDIGIFCFTKSNHNSTWMNYEAGGIANNSKKQKESIWTILFDGLSTEKLDGTPFKQFQMIKFNKDKMLHLVTTLNEFLSGQAYYKNEKTLKKDFSLYWEELRKDIKEIVNNFLIGGDDIFNEEKAIKKLKENKLFPDPLSDEVHFYKEGFEKQDLYNILLKNATKRLWFFGRKNKKLFGQENKWFFEKLNEKIEKENFEFKCLFLNPKANIKVVEKAQKKSSFKTLLKACIFDACNTLSDNELIPKELCRVYDNIRTEEIFVIDDVVMFSQICFDENEVPHPLTNASFKLVDVDNKIGKHYMQQFEDVWEKSLEIDDKFISYLKK